MAGGVNVYDLRHCRLEKSHNCCKKKLNVQATELVRRGGACPKGWFEGQDGRSDGEGVVELTLHEQEWEAGERVWGASTCCGGAEEEARHLQKGKIVCIR